MVAAQVCWLLAQELRVWRDMVSEAAGGGAPRCFFAFLGLAYKARRPSEYERERHLLPFLLHCLNLSDASRFSQETGSYSRGCRELQVEAFLALLAGVRFWQGEATYFLTKNASLLAMAIAVRACSQLSGVLSLIKR